MSHSIDLSPTRNRVVLTAREAATAGSMLRFNRAAHQFGPSHGVTPNLVDLRGCRTVGSLTHHLQFALTDMPDGAAGRKARVAMVADVGDGSNGFIEAACRGAGLDVSLFNDPMPAETHLTSAPRQTLRQAAAAGAPPAAHEDR